MSLSLLWSLEELVESHDELVAFRVRSNVMQAIVMSILYLILEANQVEFWVVFLFKMELFQQYKMSL